MRGRDPRGRSDGDVAGAADAAAATRAGLSLSTRAAHTRFSHRPVDNNGGIPGQFQLLLMMMLTVFDDWKNTWPVVS